LKNQFEQELNAHDALRHRIALHALSPDAEIPDIDWQPLRPPDEYRQFVLTENQRLCNHLQKFFRPFHADLTSPIGMVAWRKT
jgi:hypothetical protein